MNQLSESQQRAVKMAVGIATLIFLFWFIRSSGLVLESMRPPAEEGKLGNPAVAGAIVILAEILVAIGGAMVFVFSGLWRWVADFFTPLIQPQAAAAQQGVTGKEFINRTLAENRLSAEQRARLIQALVVAVELKDEKEVARVAEAIVGEKFFPRAETKATTKAGEKE